MLRVVRPSRNGRAEPVPNSPRPRAPARGRSSSMLRVVRPSRNGPAAPGTPATTEPVSVERCLTTTAAPPPSTPGPAAPSWSRSRTAQRHNPRHANHLASRSRAAAKVPFSDQHCRFPITLHWPHFRATSPAPRTPPTRPRPPSGTSCMQPPGAIDRLLGPPPPRPSASSTRPAPPLPDTRHPQPGTRNPAPNTQHPTPAARNPAPATRNLEPATPTPNTQHRIQIEHEHEDEHEHDQGRGAPVARS